MPKLPQYASSGAPIVAGGAGAVSGRALSWDGTATTSILADWLRPRLPYEGANSCISASGALFESDMCLLPLSLSVGTLVGVSLADSDALAISRARS